MKTKEKYSQSLKKPMKYLGEKQGKNASDKKNEI